MNLLWIFPDTVNCGISIYSHEYVNELRHHINIKHITPQSYIENKVLFFAHVNSSDVIHIQYETSFFNKNGRNFFISLIKSIKKPVLITLHELYSEIPGIFPRTKIKGNVLTKPLRHFLYDYKHPILTTFNNHIKNHFGSNCIHVHYDYLKRILIEKGIPSGQIEVVPHPVYMHQDIILTTFDRKNALKLGSIGFINPNYNYELLFTCLKLLDVPWTFTWTGGVRLPEHQPVLDRILYKIQENGWQDRFKITGWVPADILNQHLNNLDIYLALFKSRSSSGSLTRAIGACKPIIATDLDLTRSFVADNHSLTKNDPIVLAESDPGIIVNFINKIIADDHYRTELYQSVRQYAQSTQISNTSSKLISLYRKLLQK